MTCVGGEPHRRIDGGGDPEPDTEAAECDGCPNVEGETVDHAQQGRRVGVHTVTSSPRSKRERGNNAEWCRSTCRTGCGY